MTIDKTVLTTFDEVVEALGGVGEVGRLTDRSTSAVCNWRRKKQRFPTNLFFVMQQALVARGYAASRHLWGFVADKAPTNNDSADAANAA